MGCCDGMKRLAAIIKTFARSQAGFLSPDDFHRISQIFIDFMYYRFYRFYRFSWISGHGCCIGMIQPAARLENFARFQAGFLSSEDFHCVS